jgi:hypothetical protein
MAVNFEQDGDARGDSSFSFRHHPSIFMESRTQSGIETSVFRVERDTP